MTSIPNEHMASLASLKSSLDEVKAQLNIKNMQPSTNTPSIVSSVRSLQSTLKSEDVQSSQPIKSQSTKSTPNVDNREKHDKVGHEMPHGVRHEMPHGMKNNGMIRNDDGSFTIKSTRPSHAEYIGSREENDVMTNESDYNYVDYNSLPVNLGSDDDGDTMLPPKYWFPVPAHPPVCVTEKKCPVCPVFTEGASVDMKEWDNSRRITPPDNINVDAVRGKLNSGR